MVDLWGPAAHDDPQFTASPAAALQRTSKSCALPTPHQQLSPIVSFFCVTRTVLAPARAEAAAASQPACPPPTTTTSTPVGTSWRLPATPALEPAPAFADDIIRSAPFVEAAAAVAAAVATLREDSCGCLVRKAADGMDLPPPSSAALAAPRRLLLATACILLLEGSEWDGEGTGGSTKAAESGQRAASRTAAATTPAVAPGTATRRRGGT